jgi:hypothetical protein
MPTILYGQGLAFHFYFERLATSQCACMPRREMRSASIGCIRIVFDIVEDSKYNCSPRLRREVRQIIFEHFDQLVVAWREHSEGTVQRKTKPVLAKAIETWPEALIVIMESGSVSIPWDQCSARLSAHRR